MKLLDIAFFDTLLHHIINGVILKSLLPNIHPFEEVPTADPELSHVN